MNSLVRTLFRDLADLPPAEREKVFAARGIEPGVRAEVESLLRFDSGSSRLLTECVSGAAAETLYSSGPAPRTCGPYRLVRLLGSGGMGSVYLGERSDGEIQQNAAVKLLRSGPDDAAWHDRFLKERQFLANLNHPAVARLLDAGRTPDGQPYLAMEYVDGMAIDRYAAGKPLREQLTLFLEVCDGVSHAHGHLIIHRDLKPSNILVDTGGQPKLLDFGIAKLLDDALAQTQTADRLLTPGYASPEQLRGEAQTTATDVYSLGAVLYKLLTQRAPHESEAGMSQVLELLSGAREIPAPRSLNPSLPRDVDAMLRKALRREPEERYPSVEALAQDIRAFLESRPVAARAGDGWYRARKLLRRHWMPAAAAGLVIASLTSGLYVANRERLSAERRFRQLRQLSNQVFDLDRAIRNLPGAIEARQRLVSASLQYLEGLAADSAGDPDLARELAEGYERVALMQGVPSELNLGEPSAAEASLKKAAALMQMVRAARPDDRTAWFDSGIIAHDRMILAQSEHRRGDAVAQARLAAERLDRFRVRGGLSAAERNRLAASYANIALAYVNMHMYGDAIPQAQKTVELGRQLPSAQYRVGEGFSLLANALRYQGDLDGALRTIQEARRFVDESSYRDETERMFSSYSVLMRQGFILGEDGGVNLGRPDEAVEAFQKAFELTEAAARRDPKDSASRTRAGSAGEKLGNILRRREPARALAVYSVALQSLSEIPNNVEARRHRASLLANSSYVLRSLHRDTEARQRIDEALTLLRETRDYPAHKISLDSEAYIVLAARADFLRSQGDTSRALQVYERLYDAVMAAHPDPLDDLRDAPRMSQLYEVLAELYGRTGQSGKAAAMKSSRLALWTQWGRKLPDNPYVRGRLRAARLP